MEKLRCSSIERLTAEFAGDFPDERPNWQRWGPRQSGDGLQIAKKRTMKKKGKTVKMGGPLFLVYE